MAKGNRDMIKIFLITLCIFVLIGLITFTVPSNLSGISSAPLVTLIQERSNVLSSLIESDPQQALNSALPFEIVQELPYELQPYLEKTVIVEGDLEVKESDNFKTNTSNTYYNLTTKDGKKISVYFVDDGPGLLSGSKIKAKGLLINNKMAVASSSGTDLEVVYAKPHGHTQKKVAYIMFNFQNAQTQPYTADEARNVTYGDANNYYMEASFGQLGLVGKVNTSGDVYGWYTIPYDNTPCSYTTWSSAAKSKASVDGFVEGSYDDVIYAFPYTSACNWNGMAELGGSKLWLNVYGLGWYIVVHELGHNFGAHHASAYDCYNETNSSQRVTLSSSCTRIEYGDPFDPMGTGDYHMNAFHKAQLNWLVSSNKQTVTSSGVYTLVPLGSQSSSVQTLRIKRDSSNYLYVDFRQPYGNFENFLSANTIAKGVSIMLGPDYTTVTQTKLLDNAPWTTSFYDSTLTEGKVFQDTASGISIGMMNYSSTEAKINVTVTTPPTPPSTAPTVYITSPANNSYLIPRTTIQSKAIDSNGIAKMEIYVDNTLLKTCKNTYICSGTWRTTKVSPGQHIVTVKAVDKLDKTKVGSAFIVLTKT